MSKNPLKFLWADWRRQLPYRRYLELEDRSRRIHAQFFSLLTMVLGAIYLVWLARVVFRHRGWQDFLFLGAETLAFFLLAFLAYDIWHVRHHRPEGLEAKKPWTVDIFVPYCGEPYGIIRTTLEAVSRIDYAPLTVYVLDDEGFPQVAALASSLGFRYYSRPLAGLPREDAKGGNLNFGLAKSQGELILVLDADQVPDPDILSRLLGFFDLPRVAYVQTKQSFCLPEGDPFYNRDEIFYETVQSSNDQANAVISCGSGVMYLRRALQELGGFITWNIVEDLTTSYELLSRGWKGVYFPYALSRGLAPMTLAGVYRQRFQWCLDAMRLFFWDNPLRKRGLSWAQRFHFLLFMLSYLVSGLVFPAFYLLPLLCYWRGYSCFAGQEYNYLALRGAYLLATIMMFRYLFFKKDALKQFKMLCGLFPVYAVAILTALFCPPGRKPAYRLNNAAPLTEAGCFLFLSPHLLVILLHSSLPFMSLRLHWAPVQIVVFNALFSAFTIWVLADLVLAGLSKPQWHPTMDPRQVYGA
jgi:cellulose synthase (UDP-forming)